MTKSAWGVELGTSTVKAVKLVDDRGSVTLDDIAIISLADYGFGQGVSREEALAGALNEVRAGMGIKKGDSVYVSLTGQNTLGRIISLPPVSPERVRETIQNEARSQIPIKLEEAVWDYQIIEESLMEDDLLVNLYAAKREVVDELVDIAESAGIELTGIQVAPLGIYNYIKFEFDDSVSDQCVAIDIGADNTDVVIIDGQKTYVRVVPVAGNEITKALRVRFKLSEEDAEKLKQRAARSKDAAAVFEAMKPPLKEMVGEIYRAVGFYKSQHEDANINQLVMMGNGSKLINLKKFFEQQLQYTVHKVEMPQRLQLSRGIDPTEVQGSIQSLTVAIGLGLQGLGIEGINTINLMPRERLTEREKARLKIPVIAAGVLVLLGGILSLVLSMAGTSGVSDAVANADTAANAAQKQKSGYAGALAPLEGDVSSWSWKNLGWGQIGLLKTTQKDPDTDETTVVSRRFSMKHEAVPALLAATVQKTVAAYVAENPGRVYYANRVGARPGATGSPTNFPALRLALEETPQWVSLDEEDTTGIWTTTRTYTCDVTLAVWVDRDSEMQRAHDDLQDAMVESLEKDVRGAILAELEAAGELKGLKKQLEEIEFLDHGVKINVYSENGPNMIDLRSIFVERRLKPEGGTSVSFSSSNFTGGFSISRISVTLSLDPFAPAVEGDGEDEEVEE